MAHFGSALWPPRFGTVKSLSAVAAATAYPASATTLGTTEGTDLLTYTVPAGHTGLYMLLSAIHVNVASDAGTSQTIVAQVTYNNGVAVAVSDIGEVTAGGSATVTPVSTLTIDFKIGQSGIIRAEAGTDIAIKVAVVSGGTVATVGEFDINFAIVRVG